MHRFFSDQGALSGGLVRIRGADARQIHRVLRLKPGDFIEVLDGAGSRFRVQLQGVSITEAWGRVVGMHKEPDEAPLSIILAQVLPRSPKMDLIVQKATELGVARVIPLLSERTSCRGEASDLKLRRWRKIAKESSEQCRRRTIPDIEGSQDLFQFLERDLSGLKLLLWEGEAGHRFREMMKMNPPPSSCTLLVGPEGGFSEEEAERAKEKGYVSVSLGSRILRTESVALVALSLVQYEWGELG